MVRKTRRWRWRRDGIHQRYWYGRKNKPKKRKSTMGWAKGVTETNPNFMDGDWGGSELVYDKRRVLMDPDVFLKRQYEQSGMHVPFDEWLDVDQKSIGDMKKAILSKKDEVPVPLEEYTSYGVRKDFQEGRHRGIAAKQLGQKVPVILGRKKFAPWDRAAPDKPFKHKPAHFHEKPENVVDRWELEKDMFELDL